MKLSLGAFLIKLEFKNELKKKRKKVLLLSVQLKQFPLTTTKSYGQNVLAINFFISFFSYKFVLLGIQFTRNLRTATLKSFDSNTSS